MKCAQRHKKASSGTQRDPNCRGRFEYFRLSRRRFPIIPLNVSHWKSDVWVLFMTCFCSSALVRVTVCSYCMMIPILKVIWATKPIKAIETIQLFPPRLFSALFLSPAPYSIVYSHIYWLIWNIPSESLYHWSLTLSWTTRLLYTMMSTCIWLLPFCFLSVLIFVFSICCIKFFKTYNRFKNVF